MPSRRFQFLPIPLFRGHRASLLKIKKKKRNKLPSYFQSTSLLRNHCLFAIQMHMCFFSFAKSGAPQGSLNAFCYQRKGHINKQYRLFVKRPLLPIELTHHRAKEQQAVPTQINQLCFNKTLFTEARICRYQLYRPQLWSPCPGDTSHVGGPWSIRLRACTYTSPIIWPYIAQKEILCSLQSFKSGPVNSQRMLITPFKTGETERRNEHI